MRTPTMIAIGGAVVLAVAWVLLSRTANEPKLVPAPIVAVTPAPEPPPPAAPAPEPATPAPPAEPVKTEPVPPPPPPPEEQPAATETNDAPAAEEPAADEPADDQATDDEAAPPPLDANQAADLLADWLSRQEAEGADDAEKSDPILGKFDGEKAEGDPDWSAKAKQHIEATLNEWLANLPDEIRDHVQLISVECRETMCQILAADNDPDTQAARGEHSQEWQQAVSLLPQQPWWGELGFGDMRTSVITNDEHGYLLYQTYAMRVAPPPGAQPEVQPES
jgi:hypothetical protein